MLPTLPLIDRVKAGPRYGRGVFLPVAVLSIRMVITRTEGRTGHELLFCAWLKSWGYVSLKESVLSWLDDGLVGSILEAIGILPRLLCRWSRIIGDGSMLLPSSS